MTEGNEEPTAIVFRVEEWAAWFPIHKDTMQPQLTAVSGEAGLELKPGERLSDIQVLPVEGSLKHLPVPATATEPARNIPVKCVVFRAVLARMVTGELPKPDNSQVSQLITPENRHQRRQSRKNSA